MVVWNLSIDQSGLLPYSMFNMECVFWQPHGYDYGHLSAGSDKSSITLSSASVGTAKDFPRVRISESVAHQKCQNSLEVSPHASGYPRNAPRTLAHSAIDSSVITESGDVQNNELPLCNKKTSGGQTTSQSIVMIGLFSCADLESKQRRVAEVRFSQV